MKCAMVLCLMVVVIGFNSETATATNSHTYCVCPCLTDILTVVPTYLANCILPSGLPSDLCQTLTVIVSTIAGLVLTIVASLVSNLPSILSGGVTSLPVGITNSITGISGVVATICGVLRSYTADSGSNPIPPNVCTYFDCLLRFLIDLIWALICTIVGLVRRIIGSVPINPSTSIDEVIVSALKALLQALCDLLVCISDEIICLESTRCYLKKKLYCIINEVQALGIKEVNDFINDVLTDCIKRASIFC